MKANELMIGDYIRVIYTQKIIKVREIKQSCIYTNDNGYEYNEIEPIPLTPEILEKNGFVHYDLTDFWMWKKESFEPVHLDKYDKDGWRLRINCDNIPCECKYVHQLQHALRLCGIEKEIEL